MNLNSIQFSKKKLEIKLLLMRPMHMKQLYGPEMFSGVSRNACHRYRKMTYSQLLRKNQELVSWGTKSQGVLPCGGKGGQEGGKTGSQKFHCVMPALIILYQEQRILQICLLTAGIDVKLHQ